MITGLCAGLSSGSALHLSSANETLISELVNQDGIELKVVTVDNAQLRCGDQDVFYGVAKMTKNSILSTAGESGAYTKVILPASVGALVAINDVESPVNNRVVLKTSSKLLSPSMLLGLPGSWKGLYNTPLDSGTSLEVIEELKNASDEVVGYRVVAPKGTDGELPVAYIKTASLRDATSEDIANFNDDSNDSAPSPSVPTVTPAPQQADDVADSVDDARDEIDMNDVDQTLVDPMDSESETIERANQVEPVEIINRAPSDTDEDVDDSSVQESTQRVASNGSISASQLEDLESAFSNARKLPRGELDEALSELRAEFTRTRNQADDGTSLAKALDQRIEWLNIRIESRDQRRAIAQTLAAYDARSQQLARDIDAWQQGRAYQIVGKMMVSSVYTGEHLPLLYRIQGIDPVTGTSRTIGYVAPNADQDFRHLLGRVVGVLGKTTQDQSLKLKVIEPERIDPMPE